MSLSRWIYLLSLNNFSWPRCLPSHPSPEFVISPSRCQLPLLPFTLQIISSRSHLLCNHARARAGTRRGHALRPLARCQVHCCCVYDSYSLARSPISAPLAPDTRTEVLLERILDRFKRSDAVQRWHPVLPIDFRPVWWPVGGFRSSPLPRRESCLRRTHLSPTRWLIRISHLSAHSRFQSPFPSLKKYPQCFFLH